MADRDVAYVPEREEEVDRLLNVREKVDWVMHADNQRALFDEFYRTVVPSQSLVFFYAKHTPLAEDPQRVLVGAALVKQVRLPGSYASDGTEAFGSMPWETTVHHTLRPDQTGGILLPYRRLLAAADADPSLTLDDGVAHAPAEAWAQFSYVTEHVSSDTAIAALLARGRGAGLIVLAATQKPAHDIIPTALRDLVRFPLGAAVHDAAGLRHPSWAPAGPASATRPPISTPPNAASAGCCTKAASRSGRAATTSTTTSWPTSPHVPRPCAAGCARPATSRRPRRAGARARR